MAKIMLFDNAKRKTSLLRNYPLKIQKDQVLWTHLTSNEEKLIDIILEEFGEDDEFEEELLEDQRPRLTSTASYTVIVFSIPTKEIFESKEQISDEATIQLSFIIRRNKIISFANDPINVIDHLFADFSKKFPNNINVTEILSLILEGLVENALEVLEILEKRIDLMQADIIRNFKLKGALEKAETMKDQLFYNKKMLYADLEVVQEIMLDKGKFINVDDFNELIEDRLRYVMDFIDTANEAVKNLNTLYLTALSHNMNQHMYRLTIIGSLLLVPAIISGFWGMNVDLPLHNFWTVVGLSLILAVFLAMLLRFYVKDD